MCGAHSRAGSHSPQEGSERMMGYRFIVTVWIIVICSYAIVGVFIASYWS